VELTLTALLDSRLNFVVAAAAAHHVAAILALGVNLADTTRGPERSNGGVVVTVVWGLLDEHQVVGRGDPHTPPVQPQSASPGWLHPGGVLVFRPQIVADFSERCELLPAGDERAGATQSVTLAGDLHVVDDGPSAGLVIVEVHKLAGRLQTSRDLIGFSLPDVDKVLSKFVSVLNIVSTAAPDPGRLQVLRSAGSTAATAGQLAVPAAPGDAVDDPGARHGVGEGRLLRGYREDGAEDRGVLHSGAVPPVVPELELALSDTVPGPATHVDHVVRVEHAQLLLAGGQTFYPGAERRRGAHIR